MRHHAPFTSLLAPLLLVLLLSCHAQSQNIVTTITRTSTPSTTPPSPQYTEPPTLQSAALNSTNVFRHQHNASPLVWNETLATFASDAADTCKFAHTGGPYGENIAQGYANMTASIDGWGFERQDYDFGEGRFEKETGHFTQLVWRNTTDVGCAANECGEGKGWLVFCEYWPRGNIVGLFREQVLRQVDGENNDEGVPVGGLDDDSAAGRLGVANALFLVVMVTLAGNLWLL